jgi:hypothetical protein
MTTISAVLDVIASQGEPMTNTEIAGILGEEPRQLWSVLSRAESSGYVERQGTRPKATGDRGLPRPLWVATGKPLGEANGHFKPHGGDYGMRQRRRKAATDPTTLDFADLKAVLGADHARDIVKMIELAKVKVIMIDGDQINMAHALVEGGNIHPQSMSRLKSVFVKFFAENPASKRTFTAWLNALSEPTTDTGEAG